MASLVRPTKRQKHDHDGSGVSSKSAVPEEVICLDSTRLLSLVEIFSEAHFTCSDRLIEIIEKIRSNRYFFESNDLQENSTSSLHNYDDILSIRKLHGALILHIGFLLGSQEQTSKSNGMCGELLSALVFCLRDLYTRNSGKLSKCNTEEEFNELFILVPKILRCTSTITFPDAVRQKINVCCYQIFKSWLNTPNLLKKVIRKHTTTMLEMFLLAFLTSKNASNISNTNEQGSSLEILEQLRSLCEANLEFRKLLDVVSLVIDSQPPSCPKHLSPRLTIFYWKCITSRGETKTGKIADIEIADCAVDSMIPYTTSSDGVLSRQALECIGEFIQTSSYDRYTRVIQLLTTALLNGNLFCDETSVGGIEENDKDSNLIQTLECLGFCMKRTSASNFFLQTKGWKDVFEQLIYMAEDEKDIKVAKKASIVLVPILKTLIISAEHHSTLPFRNSMNVLLNLISLDDAKIVGLAVELLFTVLQESETRRRIDSSTLLLDLVNTLGELSSKNVFVEKSEKAQLAESFSILIDEVINVNFLARNESNLAFLVRLANGSYCEMNQNRVQEISICAIMKLARNPCNQRILAKEPGLLSSLIRYTRLTPADTEALRERSVSRKELKDRILLMASAL